MVRDLFMLDEIDRGLVQALHIDGRAPFSRIGAVLGVSTQTVARRYRRLCAEASLRVVGLADPLHAGRAQWLVRLTAGPHTAQDLAHALARRSDTSWVRLASGGTEILAVIQTPADASDGHALLLHDIPRTAGITAVSAHCLLHTYLGGPTAWRGRAGILSEQQRRQLEPNTGESTPPRSGTGQPAGPHSGTRGSAGPRPGTRESASSRPGTSEPPISRPETRESASSRPGTREPTSSRPDTREPPSPRPLAGTDHALLTALAHDGRASLADLAAATGWSPATVARRLADLRSSGALFFDVDMNDTLLGATARAMLWMSVAPAHLDAVAHTLAGHDELAFVAATTGPTNLVAQALCPNPAALHDYLTRRLGALDAIRTLETAPVLRTVKAAGPLAGPAASLPRGASPGRRAAR
ncbi:AsnC family transcriptional regulator [Streptomyces sp. NPDC001530]|uniref:Lrp/AsnC family transcriptional regulator n=1 Tax=Streptomyces sp. NPDC001530 TaxID=3364582 RepID=UPI00369724CE